MTYLILIIVIAIAVISWMTLSMPPKKAASAIVNSGPILLMVTGGILTLLRRGVIGFPLMLIGFSWWKRSRMARPISSPEGQKSTVRSVYFEMELDHDTGEMDGIVLAGSMKGMKLSSLSEEDLLSLHNEIADDGDSIALLESFLDRNHSDWRENQKYGSHSSSNRAGASSFSSMTEEEAYQVLGLKPGASDEEIHQAWRRLVRAVHPDSGGSAFLAAKINAARDLLLG